MSRDEIIDALPSHIKILHRNYKLIERSMTDFAGDGKLGSANMVKAEIEFLDTGDSDVAETILHEALHVLWSMFDLGSKDDNEEHVVRTLATGIVTVMKDNPSLFDTLQGLCDDTTTTAGD